MSFESGPVSFRFMELPHAFPKDALKFFAEHGAVGLEATGGVILRGWVTGRHILDGRIREEGVVLGGYWRLQMRESVRKVPAGYLRAACEMEELAMLEALGRSFLRGAERAEIRRGVLERLLPKVLPQVRAYPMVYEPGRDYLFTAATADGAFDEVNGLLRETLGFSGDAGDAGVLAEKLRRVDVREWEGVNFAPGGSGAGMVAAPGREFLTWVWYCAECGEGRIVLPGGQELGVMLEGPLVFVNEGEGAHTVLLRDGAPEVGVETKACLLAGKKLRRARLTFAVDSETMWRFLFDADDFVFRSLSMPRGEGLMDAGGRFRERMEWLTRWREIFLDLYGMFLDIRGDGAAWRRTVKGMREWVGGRGGRC